MKNTFQGRRYFSVFFIDKARRIQELRPEIRQNVILRHSYGHYCTDVSICTANNKPDVDVFSAFQVQLLASDEKSSWAIPGEGGNDVTCCFNSLQHSPRVTKSHIIDIADASFFHLSPPTTEPELKDTTRSDRHLGSCVRAFPIFAQYDETFFVLISQSFLNTIFRRFNRVTSLPITLRASHGRFSMPFGASLG